MPTPARAATSSVEREAQLDELAALYAEPVGMTVHATTDPEVVVVEFSYAIAASGVESTVPHIFVVRVRDGEIVESRDYSDHVGTARVRIEDGRIAELWGAQYADARDRGD
jgi:ketosteroid isomerase-like protein